MATHYNPLIKISAGGGLLSQFYQVLGYFYDSKDTIEGKLTLDKGKGLERLVVGYLGEPKENFYKMSNWWDSVLDQPSSYEGIIEITNGYKPTYNYFTDKDGLDKLKFERNFVSNYLTFHPELLFLVEKWSKDFNLNQNTLAVHLRLTDLNDVHTEIYGKCSIEDYLEVINLALKENPNIDKIFVASESEPNIKILQSSLPIPVVFVPELTRTKKVKDTHLFYKEQIEFLKQPNYSREVFLDLLLLAECCTLVGRMSSVTNASILFNKNLNQYYCVNQLKDKI